MRWQTLHEGRWVIAVVAALCASASVLAPWPVLLATVGLFAFVLYFFRDPKRVVPGGETTPVAPADGVVADIAHGLEVDGFHGPVTRVGVFLSVLDVHVNRVPLSARVEASIEQTGRFLDARHPDAGKLNACRTWDFVTPGGRRFRVRQITGAIARRIVAWSAPGEDLQKGARFGMIRFGSRTELYLPEPLRLRITVGEKVRAGVTILAEFPNE